MIKYKYDILSPSLSSTQYTDKAMRSVGSRGIWSLPLSPLSLLTEWAGLS